ncbi:hypothetical protein BH11ACT4_BH11ACT4_24000 [soil metagenome]
MTDSMPEPRHPKHRREGVPLDGAPDLGRFTPPASVPPPPPEPVRPELPTPESWSANPLELAPPPPEPPQYPAPPTVSEYRPFEG